MSNVVGSLLEDEHIEAYKKEFYLNDGWDWY